MSRKLIPTKAELLTYANVPVKVAAAYLGVTEQAVRCRIRAKGDEHWNIGYCNGRRSLIPPQLLISFKEGIAQKEKCEIELKTIGAFLESGALHFDDILALAIGKAK